MCPESLYIKAQNKWWDGYSGESHVLLDDMDGNFLGHYLKIWADKYACAGEIKGGVVVKLHHAAFVVTSNYSIEAMWKDDPVMAAAIKRRFEVIHMTTPYMFKPTSQTALSISKANHIFGTTPLIPRPVRKTNTGLPVVAEWRKQKTDAGQQCCTYLRASSY